MVLADLCEQVREKWGVFRVYLEGNKRAALILQGLCLFLFSFRNIKQHVSYQEEKVFKVFMQDFILGMLENWLIFQVLQFLLNLGLFLLRLRCFYRILLLVKYFLILLFLPIFLVISVYFFFVLYQDKFSMKLLEKPIVFEELRACLEAIYVNGLFLFLKTFQSSGQFSLIGSLFDFIFPVFVFILYLFAKSCRKK